MEGGGKRWDKLTTDENAQPRHRTIRQPALQPLLTHIAAPLAPNAPREIGAQSHEDTQADDLEAQAGDHDVDPGLLEGFGVGGVGERAADGLHDEGEDVAADEDDGVGAGFEAGEGFAVDDDDAGEGEVDGGGDEAGGDGEDDEVPFVSLGVSSCYLALWGRF